MIPGETEAATEETDRAEMAGEEARLGPEAARAMTRVALIGCGAQKAARTCAAREMYRSPLFQGALRWSLLHCDAVYILSAKHGLLGLDEVIEPYDETLPRDLADRLAWGRKVGAQIVGAVGEIEARLVVLAGEKYADAVSFDDPEWEYEWEEPLRGLEIGERLAWFKAQRTADVGDDEREAA